VTTIGVGSGFSYDDSGPTHHSTDDVAFMRVLPNLTILNGSDSLMAARFADMACRIPGPSYVRLDRKVLPSLYKKGTTFEEGLSILKPGKDLWIIATGNMVHRALEVADELGRESIEAGVIDLYRLKPIDSNFLLKIIDSAEAIVTLEEHLLAGGLGSIVAEIVADAGRAVPLKRIGIPDRYYYAYGGRENIQKICGLDQDQIRKTILEWKARPGWRQGPGLRRKARAKAGAVHA